MATKSTTKTAKTTAKTADKTSGTGAKAAKPMSKVNERKAAKAKTAARKQASKTQVRLTRAALRASKNATKATGKGKSQSATKLEATKGQAPHSARITAVKGPVQAEASRTVFAPKYSTDRKWLIVDAAGQTVGRLASEIAMLLRGKHKPTFTPNNDAGDFVVVLNSDQVKFSANKEEQKEYNKHSGYIGGLKTVNPRTLRAKNQSARIIFNAVKGMVPRNPLGRRQMLKLKIYSGAQHPHTAQQPVAWQLRNATSTK